MIQIKDKSNENQQLELVYDNDGDIDLRIDGKILMCFFQDGDVTIEEDLLDKFNVDIVGWSR